MAALLSSKIGNQDNILKYIVSCRDMDIEVLPPDVQKSQRHFIPSGKSIIFGLGGMKNVGDEAINEIIKAREDGEFRSLYDLCRRVNQRKVTKRVLESLIKGGACDSFNISRAALFGGLDMVVSKAQTKAKDKQSKQTNLFDLLPQVEEVHMKGLGFECQENFFPEWDSEQKLVFEKDSLGFYLTGHPLEPYRQDLHRLNLITLQNAREMNNSRIETAVLVASIKEKITKKGEKMASVQVEDLSGHAEVVFFPKSYSIYASLLKKDKALLVLNALVEANDELDDEFDDGEVLLELKLRAESVKPLEQACQECDAPVILRYPDQIDEAENEQFKAILKKHQGTAPVNINLELDGVRCTMQFGPEWRVTSTPLLYKDVDAWARACKTEAQKTS